MVRQFSVILGVGLAVLWIAGLSSPFVPSWIAWLEGIGAISAFLVASSGPRPFSISNGVAAAGPFGIAVGLFALWLVALSTAVIPWMTWWTFAFACAFLALGFAAISHRTRMMNRTFSRDVPRDLSGREDAFRKSA